MGRLGTQVSAVTELRCNFWWLKLNTIRAKKFYFHNNNLSVSKSVTRKLVFKCQPILYKTVNHCCPIICSLKDERVFSFVIVMTHAQAATHPWNKKTHRIKLLKGSKDIASTSLLYNAHLILASIQVK